MLRDELNAAREQTDLLFRLLSPEALYSRPVAERHRLIFYLGHFDAFDWNLLGRRASGENPLHSTFDSLFERGIDPPPGQTPADTPADWPSRAEVDRYIAQTRARVDVLLPHADPEVVQMAIEHRLMHAETFAYLLHNLEPGTLAKSAAPESQPATRSSLNNLFIPVSAGSALMGQPDSRFGWDNERKAHTVEVPAFAISKFKITNGEFLPFALESGSIPHFWRPHNGAFLLRGIFENHPLPLDHPVWVTWQQAEAYASWRGLKLPTEAQWLRASSLCPADPARDNFGFHRFATVPVDHGNEHTNGHAPVQLTGNGWEWTRDLFQPFDGFTPHPFYPGYSADFFDGQHYVLKGASPRTAALIARPSFRNWFRKKYPHMYAGFRLVKD